MVHPKTPNKTFKKYTLKMRAPSIEHQDTKQNQIYQLKNKINNLKHKIYLIVHELKKIKKKTPTLKHYKEKKIIKLKTEQNKLKTKKNILKKSLKIYDSQIIETIWTTPEQPKTSPQKIKKLMKSELKKQYKK